MLYIARVDCLTGLSISVLRSLQYLPPSLSLPSSPAADYTMVSFVKPNLLGTRREFTNRFMNPINNGQLRDSLPHDVRLMKQRAHILHKLLAGTVQVSSASFLRLSFRSVEVSSLYMYM